MKPHPEQNQISSLIKLIDDRDEFVRTQVRKRLIELGEDTLPFLEIAERDGNPLLRNPIGDIIRTILSQRMEEKFHRLAASSSHPDLEEGMMLIMEFGYPDADRESMRRTLDHYAEQLSARIKQNDSSSQVIGKLAHFLFEEIGFKGNADDYYNPDNCYLNRVLERKTGLPISLSALCVLLGQRLGKPIEGVALPGHYIAKYESPSQTVFFDPFNAGRIVTPADCQNLVTAMGFTFQEHYLSPAMHGETLVRMINNLINIYQRKQDSEKTGILERFIQALTRPREGRPARPV